MGLIDALFLWVIDILTQIGKVIIVVAFAVALLLVALLLICLIWGLMLP